MEVSPEIVPKQNKTLFRENLYSLRARTANSKSSESGHGNINESSCEVPDNMGTEFRGLWLTTVLVLLAGWEYGRRGYQIFQKKKKNLGGEISKFSNIGN